MEKKYALSVSSSAPDTSASDTSVNKYYQYNQPSYFPPLNCFSRINNNNSSNNNNKNNSSATIHHVPTFSSSNNNNNSNNNLYTSANTCFALTPERYRFFRYANGCSTVNVLLIESIIKLIAAMIGRDKLPAQTKRSKFRTCHTNNTTTTGTQINIISSRNNNNNNNNISSSRSASLSALNRTRNIDSIYEMNSNEPIQVGWNR